jgi:hypothetical protein
VLQSEVDGLACGDLKELNQLIVGGLHNSKDIWRQSNSLFVHKLD